MKRSKHLRQNIVNAVDETSHDEPAIFRLNEDCMRQIVSFLSIKERIRLVRVCKKWQALIKLPWTDIKELKVSFILKMDKHKIKYTVPILKQILGYCGNSITSLSLGSWEETGFNKPIIIFIKRTCPNLRSLNLEGVKLHCKTAEFLADNFNNLTHIALGWCQSGCTKTISKLFSNNKQLKSIKFMECYTLRGVCFSKLPADSIESLTFSQSCSFSINDIIKVIGNFTKLRTLHIDRNNELIDNLNGLLEALPNKLILENLTLNAHYGYTKNLALLSSIRCFTNLRKITLNGRLVCNELLTIIGENCRQLSSVHLSGSEELADFGLKNLLDSSGIEELSIRFMKRISDTFFAHVNLPSLKIFKSYLIDQWTNESFRLLMLASKNLSQLRIRSSSQVDFDMLIDDALQYTSSRSSEKVLELFLEGDGIVSEVRRISPRLIVELKSTTSYFLSAVDFD